MGSERDDLAVDVLGFFLDGFIGDKEGGFAVEDLIDAGAELRPELAGDVEMAAEIEDGVLGDLFAEAFGLDEPVGEIGLAGGGGVGPGLADEHGQLIRAQG